MPMTTSDSAPIAIDTAIVGDMGGDGTDASGVGGRVGCTMRSVVDKSNRRSQAHDLVPHTSTGNGGLWGSMVCGNCCSRSVGP